MVEIYEEQVICKKKKILTGCGKGPNRCAGVVACCWSGPGQQSLPQGTIAAYFISQSLYQQDASCLRGRETHLVLRKCHVRPQHVYFAFV